MKSLKRIFTALLILLTFNLYLPKITFAEQSLTKHPLETRSTPEEEIPTIKEKTSGWKWLIVLGLVGGMVAVAAGGGGGGNGGDSETGDVDYNW